MPELRSSTARFAAYFDRPPEKLVLDGYRHWIRGTVLRSSKPWTEAQILYRGILGDEDGERAIIALARFVRTLGQCAICPPRVFNAGSRCICRDETLVMGLIAGIQNCDDPTVRLCLERLCSWNLRERTAIAAGTFAQTLKVLDYTMLPIPAHVVERILARSHENAFDALTSGTIH